MRNNKGIKKMGDPYDNLSLDPSVQDDEEYQNLLEEIRESKLLVSLDPGQNLCHVTPTNELKLDEPMFFASTCDYGMWLQYKRNSKDEDDMTSWKKDREWEDDDDEESSEEELPEMNFYEGTPEFFYSVKIKTPSPPLILFYNDDDSLTGDEKTKLIKQLLMIRGLDGFYGKDSVTDISGNHNSTVDEIVILRPNTCFSEFDIKKITLKELEDEGRSLNEFYREDLPYGNAEELIDVTEL